MTDTDTPQIPQFDLSGIGKKPSPTEEMRRKTEELAERTRNKLVALSHGGVTLKPEFIVEMKLHAIITYLQTLFPGADVELDYLFNVKLAEAAEQMESELNRQVLLGRDRQARR